MDRVSAARDRVRVVKAELRSPAVHSPCIQCRHYELACTHPAVAKITADPETGAVKLSAVSAKDARSEEGACGPEGALFDARSPVGLAVVSLLSTSSGRWALGIGAFLAGCYLFG